MTDLQIWKKLLNKQNDTGWGDWVVYPDDENPKMARCLSFGCPDNNGAHLEVLFDKKGKMIKAEVINPDGYTCNCKWCKTKTGFGSSK